MNKVSLLAFCAVSLLAFSAAPAYAGNGIQSGPTTCYWLSTHGSKSDVVRSKSKPEPCNVTEHDAINEHGITITMEEGAVFASDEVYDIDNGTISSSVHTSNLSGDFENDPSKDTFNCARLASMHASMRDVLICVNMDDPRVTQH